MRYRDLLESFSGYYHYSKTPLEPGTVITPRGNFSIDSEIQSLLELYRPENMSPRNKVVYMMKNPNDSIHYGVGARTNDGYVYKVKPSKPISKHDASVIGYLQKIYREYQAGHNKYLWKNEDHKKELAKIYWSGEPNPFVIRAKRLWEYTAPTAIVEYKVNI